ncbi:MAG: c-type cytochrome domain-containing protein, partial [Planctomycetota bacterium]
MSRSAFPAPELTRFAICLILAFLMLPLRADERESFFENEIRPLLIENCLECHSEETERSGNLGLDSAQGWRNGGDLGPAIVAGEPDQSLLIKAIRYDERDLEMPPEGKLPAQAIQAFEKWVREGAVDPRTAASGT